MANFSSPSEAFYERLSFIDRFALTGRITLPSGVEGIISGPNNDFATFTDADGFSCEYAWQTVERFRNAQ